MIRKMAVVLLLPLLLASCMTQGSGVDSQTDKKLGVEAESENQDANAAVQNLRQAQMQEQRRQLERQITDPTVR